MGATGSAGSAGRRRTENICTAQLLRRHRACRLPNLWNRRDQPNPSLAATRQWVPCRITIGKLPINQIFFGLGLTTIFFGLVSTQTRPTWSLSLVSRLNHHQKAADYFLLQFFGLCFMRNTQQENIFFLHERLASLTFRLK